MLKKLSKNIKGYYKASILSPILIMGEVLMEVIIPTLLALLIDNGIDGNNGEGDLRYIFYIGIAIAVCCIISLFFGAAAGRYAAIAATGFATCARFVIRITGV